MVTLVEEQLPPSSTYVVGPVDVDSKVSSVDTRSETGELAAAVWPIDSEAVEAPASEGCSTQGGGSAMAVSYTHLTLPTICSV
eukprot:2823787-Prymnesium_polylepis.1